MIKNIYFDNASTSYPKPLALGEKMRHFLIEEGGTYGRSSYERVFKTSAQVEECRERLGDYLGVEKVENIAFTLNATNAINLIIGGLKNLKKAWVSPLEHHAVVRALVGRGIEVEVLKGGPDGGLDFSQPLPHEFSQKGGCPKENRHKSPYLVIINHASNVNGLVQDLSSLRKWLGEEIPIMVDASQSLGAVPLYGDAWDLDYIAFTGHKSLLGPTGVGGFYVKEAQFLDIGIYGGTASNSDSFLMPELAPDKFQAGTPNTVGIIGLLAALDNRPQSLHSPQDFLNLLDKLKKDDFWQLYMAQDSSWQIEVFSILPKQALGDNPSPHPLAACSAMNNFLYQNFGIEARSGLHCALMAHESLGSAKTGTLRLALSPYHSPQDLDYLYQALQAYKDELLKP